jgi:hypothetical protein
MSLKRRITRQLQRSADLRNAERPPTRLELDAARARARTLAKQGAETIRQLGAALPPALTQPRRPAPAHHQLSPAAVAEAQRIIATARAAGLEGRRSAGSGGDNTGGRP